MPKYEVCNALKKSDRQPPPSNRSNDRELRAIAMYRYRHCLCQAIDIEEFKQAFIDCVECHFHAFQTGRVLHCNISENSLIISQSVKTVRNERENFAESGENASARRASVFITESKSVEIDESRVHGVLIDFDMAVLLGPDGKPATPSAGHHHVTGTLTFMARHLLQTPEERDEDQLLYPTIPTFHLYRHDLESFFYIPVWAATCYDLTAHKKLKLPKGSYLIDWSNNINLGRARIAKELGDTLMKNLRRGILPEWKGVWREWIMPLFVLFEEGLRCSEAAQKRGNIDDFITGGERLTFDNFMRTIRGETLNFDSKK